MTEDGITFYYNPYDIGCYALGGVEVHITREEMQGL
ncbi:RsiV family protein [Alistipes putredinis]